MIVFTGEDTYESYTQAKAWLNQMTKEQANNEIRIIEVDQIRNVNDFLYSLESIDIFGETPIIFAKRILDNKEIGNYIVENLAKLKNSNIVIWQDKGLDKKTKLYKILTKNMMVRSFPLLKSYEISSWLKQKAKDLGLQIESEVVEFIIENVSIDKWIITSELLKLQKLGIIKVGLDEIKEVLGINIKGDLWKFIDFVGYRDKKKAIIEFDKLIKYEDLTQLIITLLQRELRIISQILYSESNSVKYTDLGIPPFALKKAMEKSYKFNKKEIKTFVTRLFNLDYAIKSGEIDAKMGLTVFLLTI